MNAVIYARYSSEMQRDGNSIQGQIDECTKYANSNKITVIKTYIDEAKTGQNVAGRDGFKQMLHDAYNKKFDALIVYDLSRFSRNMKEYREFKDILVDELGIRFISVCEKIDETPEGFLLESMQVMLNEYYIRKLSASTIRGLNVNARQGKFNGGTAPLGYYIDSNGFYQINKNERPIVQMIFDLYLTGMGYLSICNKLNELGFKTRKGQEFGKNSIYEILRNKKYMGLYEFNRTPKTQKYQKANNHARRNEEEIIKVDNAIPPIITAEQFQKVQDKLKRREKGTPANGEVYLLRGLITCGKCGNILLGHKAVNRNKDIYYGYCCSNKTRNKTCNLRIINKQVIENEVLLFLRDIYTDETRANIYEYVGRHLNRYKDDKTNKIKILKTEIDKNKKQADLLLTNFDGTNKLVNNKINELNNLIEKYEKEIEHLKMQSESSESITPKMIAAELDELNGLENKSKEEQRRIINKYIKKVVINEDNDNFHIDIFSNLDKFCVRNCGGRGGT